MRQSALEHALGDEASLNHGQWNTIFAGYRGDLQLRFAKVLGAEISSILEVDDSRPKMPEVARLSAAQAIIEQLNERLVRFKSLLAAEYDQYSIEMRLRQNEEELRNTVAWMQDTKDVKSRALFGKPEAAKAQEAYTALFREKVELLLQQRVYQEMVYILDALGAAETDQDGHLSVLARAAQELEALQKTEEVDLHQLRLDAATPEQVYLNRAFTIAIAVRFPSSPVLTIEDLSNVRSASVQVNWLESTPCVRLRVCVSSAACKICGEDSRSFPLYREVDSPRIHFELIPKKLGTISIIIRVYQENDSLGSARVRTTVCEEEVGNMQLKVNSHTFQVPQDTQVFFGDFITGDKHTHIDQRGQVIQGPQTNIAGDVQGSTTSGKSESTTVTSSQAVQSCTDRNGGENSG